MPIKTSELKPEEKIQGEDLDETNSLKAMLEKATDYVREFSWCPPIHSRFMAFGIGGVVGVFLLKFSKTIQNSKDKEVWVVCGDLPSVYMVTEDLPDSKAVLYEYCNLMQDWIDAVLTNGNLEEVYPVEDPPTHGNAKALKKRINFIKTELLKT